MSLLRLGPVTFDIMPLNFQKIKRESEAFWPTIPRFGGRPGRQHTGFGENVLSIHGTLYPGEFGGQNKYEQLRYLVDRAEPVMMIGWASFSKAQVFGYFVVLKIPDSLDFFNQKGEPQKIIYNVDVAPHDYSEAREHLFRGRV